MHVTWDPEDGNPPIEFEFDADDDLMSKEATLIEAEYGQPIEMWTNGLRGKEAKARRLMLWWHLRQSHPKLAFKDVPDFRMRQMKVEMNVGELQELWKQISKNRMSDERREQLEGAFETSIRDAMEREGIVTGDIVGEDGSPGNLLDPVR
jgi:hypothetical protein